MEEGRTCVKITEHKLYFRSLLKLMLGVLPMVLCSCWPIDKDLESNSWRYYRGDPGSNAYSGLDLINKQNVGELKVAWTYRTGDSREGSSIQCNPLIIDNILYGTTPGLKVFALNAATGEKLWEYDPSGGDPGNRTGGTNRGLTYWENGDQKRLYYCVKHELKALDASDGTLITGFGNQGSVDMREGLDLPAPRGSLDITNTTPGVIFEDLIILGSSVLEAHGSLPGHIRAYNVNTGELKWIFHTIPHPGEFGYETWPEDYYLHGGGANAWGGMSVDYGRGIVYIPLGAATHDFYGGDRHGKGLFANCVLALDAATGKYRWHYQVSHHDLWDYDLPTAPNLTSIQLDGSKKDVVVQLTKQGLIFILDRETGAPVFETVERPVPQSNVPGEAAWPTQPFPTRPLPLVRQQFTPDDVTNITPESRANVLEQIEGFRYGGIYTPPSLPGTVQLPGYRGGAEWSGGAIDPKTGYMYVGVNDIPNLVQLVEVQAVAAQGASESSWMYGQRMYQAHCASCHGQELEGSINYPSLISVESRLSLSEAAQLLREGRGMMPSFGAVAEIDRQAILTYLFNRKPESVEQPPQREVHSNQSIVNNYPAGYKLKAYQQLRDHLGYPGAAPPWGSMCAVDLNTGETLWKVALGEYRELTELGIPATGTQLFGGGLVTAGGLIFIGASRDEKFRALDKHTGEVLWEFQLPAGGYATPATYRINGRQMVVIAAGGGGMQGTRSGDYYFAFGLPEGER